MAKKGETRKVGKKCRKEEGEEEEKEVEKEDENEVSSIIRYRQLLAFLYNPTTQWRPKLH